MATILKSNPDEPTRATNLGEFNLRDVQQQAEKILAEARELAEEIRDSAHEQAAQVLEEAKRQGLVAAQVEFQQQVHEKAERLNVEQSASNVAACKEAMQQISLTTTQWLTEWRDETVDIAILIAEKILQHEIQHNRSVVLRKWLATAFGRIGKADSLQVMVHPQDLQAAQAMVDEVAMQLPFAAKIELTASDKIDLGGCTLKSEHGIVDMQLQTQLERLANELTSSGGGG